MGVFEASKEESCKLGLLSRREAGCCFADLCYFRHGVSLASDGRFRELGFFPQINRPRCHFLVAQHEGLPDAIAMLINHAMLVERQHHLGAAAYQRSESRQGHANGFKERELNTRMGSLALRIPQVRDCEDPFFPSALERGQRSEKALGIAVAEMYLQGVSTRRVNKVMEELCGMNISSSQVSKAAAERDATRRTPSGRLCSGLVDPSWLGQPTAPSLPSRPSVQIPRSGRFPTPLG